MNMVSVGGPPTPRLPGVYHPSHSGGSPLPSFQVQNPLPHSPYFRAHDEHWILPPMMLAAGTFALALAYIQPSLKNPANESEAMYYQGLFALLCLLWSQVVTQRHRVRAAAISAAHDHTWTDTGDPDGLPKKDWTTATAPPDGYSLLQLAEAQRQADAPATSPRWEGARAAATSRSRASHLSPPLAVPSAGRSDSGRDDGGTDDT